jgi:hypothetical protein
MKTKLNENKQNLIKSRKHEYTTETAINYIAC